MNNSIKKPQNVEDLKKLLNQYGKMLAPQNRQFIDELIQNLESGGNQAGLQDLAQRMQKSVNKK